MNVLFNSKFSVPTIKHLSILPIKIGKKDRDPLAIYLKSGKLASSCCFKRTPINTASPLDGELDAQLGTRYCT